MAVWAVIIASQVREQNKDTNKKIDCIALFFNQDRRPEKKVSVGEQCKIVPTL